MRKPAAWTTVAQAFRRVALPLTSYYAVTLALPLTNGAAESGARFVDHALVVLAVPPALIVLAGLVQTSVRMSFRRGAQARQGRLASPDGDARRARRRRP